jgi:hypothetical protein
MECANGCGITENEYRIMDERKVVSKYYSGISLNIITT